MSLTSYRAAPPRGDGVMNADTGLLGRCWNVVVIGFVVSLEDLAATYSSMP